MSSIVKQEINRREYEILIVDDASTDSTAEVIASYETKLENLQYIKLPLNRGPGVARNHAIERARGQYVLFCDADDRFASESLLTLQHFIEEQKIQPDLVAFNWCQIGDNDRNPKFSRRDAEFLVSRDETVRHYLRHHMDGSVIFTAFRRIFIDDSRMTFAEGLHEDVDFLFEAYARSSVTKYLDRVLYEHRVRADSITQRISTLHIDGYLRAWLRIRELVETVFVTSREAIAFQKDLAIGLMGVIASRAREIVRHEGSGVARHQLFQHLAMRIRLLDLVPDLMDDSIPTYTTYSKIFRTFSGRYLGGGNPTNSDADYVTDIVHGLEDKTWSCTDLHHSLFLAPGEVRTCCKRFFVNGEMRGDVVLDGIQIIEGESLNLREVLEVKRSLLGKINRGDHSACDGCPFMSLQEWGPIERLDVKYLSMEQHSICNLRCAYCDDKYYGGAKSVYSVEQTINELVASGSLANCHTVVWGGGEPLLDPNFDQMMTQISDYVPAAQHRVLSNGLRFSEALSHQLQSRQAQLVTSVDAGTEETFVLVRGRSGLLTVVENLKKYHNCNPNRVTIKYIITSQNNSIPEIGAFCELMHNHDLSNSFFQISSDFKSVAVDDATVIAALELYRRLILIGAKHIYLDDLFRIRIGSRQHLAQFFQNLGGNLPLSDFIADPREYPEIAIWGAGQLTDLLLSQQEFRERWQIKMVVDSTKTKIGSQFSGFQVRHPIELRHSSFPVFLAAVQGIPLMFEEFQELGLDEQRIIRKLLL